MTSSLLINEPPLQVLPTLAEGIGLNESIVLQQIQYWISMPKIGRVHEGKRWVRNSLEDWQRDNFKFWSVSTIQRILKSLLKLGVLLKTKILNSNKYDHTLWYTIDYEHLNNKYLKSQKDNSDQVNLTETPVAPSGPAIPALNPAVDDSVKLTAPDSVKLTESSTETLSENTNTPSAHAEDVLPKPKPFEKTFDVLALECFSLKKGQVNGQGGRIGAILHGRKGKNGSPGLWKLNFGLKQYAPEQDLDFSEELGRMFKWWGETKPKLSVPTSDLSIWKALCEFRKTVAPPPDLDENGMNLNDLEPDPLYPGVYQIKGAR